MSEARKYHLNLIVANQFTTQLTEEIRDAVFGNIGTIVSFRIGQTDIESIGRYFQPVFDSEDLLRVPNYHTIVRTLIGGVPTQPFSMATLPPLGTPNPRLSVALKQLSAAKHGRPRAIVEQEINERMKTKLPPGRLASQPQAGSSSAQSPGLASTRPPAPQKSGSLVDDWLKKRGGGTSPQPAISPVPAQASSGISAQTALPTTTSPSPVADPALFRPTDETAALIANQAAPTTTKNISSQQLEKTEVDQIAKEIKSEMASSQSSKPPAPPVETPVPVPAEPPKAKTEHEVSLRGDQTEPDEGDTIVIDRSGNLQTLKSD
jgi:hypothetical protein